MTLMDLCMFVRSSRAAIVLGVFADPCNFSAGTLWRCWLTEGVDFVRRIGIRVLFWRLICGRTASSSRQIPGNTWISASTIASFAPFYDWQQIARNGETIKQPMPRPNG